ncbi:MAG TPA: enoyl-CoA hydratase/isomerase family protein [Ramlibacter sp.]|nr:enoyl-CoA hydratase/isomerase family protein [Ramlibacter sp.]
MDTDREITSHLDGHVATVTFRRAQHNYLDLDLVRELADHLDELGANAWCRAIVLHSGGQSFSAGANFSRGGDGLQDTGPAEFYRQAMRLFDVKKPIIAAVRGAAIGAGAGLAVAADFRVTCPEARFSFNFNRIGIHPGFGLTCTLPRLIGAQKSALLFYTGRRLDGEEAVRIGLADLLVPRDEVLAHAQALAAEIAQSAPLAVASTRAALREELVADARAMNRQELAAQESQLRSEDFQEGVLAMTERRTPLFLSR